jgi:hypothetical protein
VIVEPIEEKTEQLIPVPEPVKVNGFLLSYAEGIVTS